MNMHYECLARIMSAAPSCYSRIERVNYYQCPGRTHEIISNGRPIRFGIHREGSGEYIRPDELFFRKIIDYRTAATVYGKMNAP